MRSTSGKVIFKHIESSMERAVDRFLQQLNTNAKDITPIRTGYARSKWQYLHGWKLGSSVNVIQNRAPYIGLLDGVLGQPTSKQAPRGIIIPAIEKLIKRNELI